MKCNICDKLIVEEMERMPLLDEKDQFYFLCNGCFIRKEKISRKESRK